MAFGVRVPPFDFAQGGLSRKEGEKWGTQRSPGWRSKELESPGHEESRRVLAPALFRV